MARYPSYIDNRKGIWLVRAMVPASQRKRVGKSVLFQSLGIRDRSLAERLKHPVVAQFLALIQAPAPPLHARLESYHGIPMSWSNQQAAAALDLLDLGAKEDQIGPRATVPITIDLPLDADDRERLAVIVRTERDLWSNMFPPDDDAAPSNDSLPPVSILRAPAGTGRAHQDRPGLPAGGTGNRARP